MKRSRATIASGPNVAIREDRLGRTIEFGYDNLHRLISEDWYDGVTLVHSITYEFDAGNQLLEANDPGAVNLFTFDGLGRVTQEAMTFDGFADTITLDQEFDAHGNRTATAWNFGTTEEITGAFLFDGLNRLTEMTHASDEQADFWHRGQFSYNALGQFTEINRFVGTSTTPIALADTTFGYDDLNRLTSILHTTDTTTWAGYDYVYDVASRITSIDSHLDGLSTYTHDVTNQLTGADHTGSSDETYTYDANGNRTMSGYDTDPNNQLASDGTHNYTYDAEGNREFRTVIATGFVTKYLWDHRNRLVGVEEYDDEENLLSTVTNTYDAFNRWIRREVDADGPGGSDPVDTFFAWDSLQLALEFTDDNGSAIDGDDLTQVRTWAPGVDQIMAEFADGGDLNFGLTDHLGTPRDWVAYDSITTDTITTGHQIYNAFGVETSTTGFNSFIGFTGRPFEITIGLQYNLHRWYDAKVGRWVSEDRIGFRAGDANLSRYVINAPICSASPETGESHCVG